MRNFGLILLKLWWAAYLLLTTLYCLVAYLPYTYFALIKTPIYGWVPWFQRNHALLYWTAFLAIIAALWPRRAGWSHLILAGILALIGLGLSIWPLLPRVANNPAAFWGGTASLWLLAILCGWDLFAEKKPLAPNRSVLGLFEYSTGIYVAACIALVYLAGVQFRTYHDTLTLNLRVRDLEVAGWSLISHIVLALVAISVLNLIRLAVARSAHAHNLWRVFLGMLVLAAIWALAGRFLTIQLNFRGWHAQLFAASLAAALSLLGFSIVDSFIDRARSEDPGPSEVRNRWLRPLALFLCGTAFFFPAFVGADDWNGVLQGTFALLFWVVLSICGYSIRSRRAAYRARTVFAVLLMTALVYKGLQASENKWGRAMGPSRDYISTTLLVYADSDASFALVDALLGNVRYQPCGEFCAILRSYSEIRDARVSGDSNLVDTLVAAKGDRPDLFFFVIDSMRPDYLGAYNPRADFTPNLDAFARENLVIHNVYSPYAGTSLSEPAIWAGAYLLHAHFMKPFSKVNGLEKLAKTDGYRLVVSNDDVLSQVLGPSGDLVKIDDVDQPWGALELCSTLRKMERYLEKHDDTQPILFYTQPKNIHQHAQNNLPPMSPSNWRARPGFSNRIAYETSQVDSCLGPFFSFLKASGRYDRSIIIVTSDHGDATGEFGRTSHSNLIYPEIMRVPLFIHLPETMRQAVVYDDKRVSSLTDITPSLYYLLGHRPIVSSPIFGRPLFTETERELHSYQRNELLLASDSRPVYGLLSDREEYFYVTYASPPQSYLYNLARDPDGVHDVLTAETKAEYDRRIIGHLQEIANFYGYKPSVVSFLPSAH